MGKRKRLISLVLCFTIAAALAIGFAACSSEEAIGNGDTFHQASQDGQRDGQWGGVPGGEGGMMMDTTSIAVILGIDQASLDNAIKQAQSEMQAARTDALSCDTSPMDNSSTDDHHSDIERGGGRNKVLSRVAEMLGIDIAEVQDAFAQSMPTDTPQGGQGRSGSGIPSVTNKA